jgi:hypothetical protein
MASYEFGRGGDKSMPLAANMALTSASAMSLSDTQHEHGAGIEHGCPQLSHVQGGHFSQWSGTGVSGHREPVAAPHPWQ